MNIRDALHRLTILGAMAGFSLAASAASPNWKLIAKQGSMRIIVITSGDLSDEDTYRFAMAGACKTERVCTALFFKDEKLAPKALPMSDAQAKAQIASWNRNLNTGRNRLALACKIKRSPDCF